MNQKIWIYIIEKKLNVAELNALFFECQEFVRHWKSHEMPVQASVELYKERLLIFRNNEDFNPIGGCATDNLFRFIQQLEKKYNTNLLNRKLVVFEKNNELAVKPLNEITTVFQSGEIDENTIIYNTSIIHSDEWEQFRQPLKNSWLQNIIQTVQ